MRWIVGSLTQFHTTDLPELATIEGQDPIGMDFGSQGN